MIAGCFGISFAAFFGDLFTFEVLLEYWGLIRLVQVMFFAKIVQNFQGAKLTIR